MEGELEAVGEEGAEHAHLLVAGGALFAGGDGEDVEVVVIDPGGAAGDGLGVAGRRRRR